MRGRTGNSAYQLAARSQVRRTGLVTVGVLVVTLALALAIARAWRLGVAGTAVTVLVAGGGPALLYVTWATFRDSALKTPQPGLAELADQLAVAMGRQWAAEASMRRLNDPYPLPVSWSPADPGLADSWEVLETLARTGAGWPVPDPGLWARHPGELGGKGEGLAAVLTRVPTGRLVVLGEPGSGKTMLMVRLVLDLLAGRSPGGPVPFLVSLASWNPEQQDLREWLAGQLAVGRPALSGPAWGADGSVAEALLDVGLVVPLLDGLDEIPEPVRGPAIARINDALGAGQVTVLTCRTPEFRQAVGPPGRPQVRLRGAAAVLLDPLSVETVGAYLVADAGGPDAGARWAPVLEALGGGTPVAEALTTPLMVGLARAIYNPRPDELRSELRDPAELCGPALSDRVAVEAHLLGAFIPACYRAAERWTAGQAMAWLTFLAHHLEATIGGPDLAWWLLRQSTPFADHVRTPGRGQHKPPLPTPAPARHIRLRPAKILTGIVLGAVAGTAMGLLSAWNGPGSSGAEMPPGQARAFGIFCALVSACILIFPIGLEPVPHDLNSPVRTRDLVANDRRISLGMIAATATVVTAAATIAAGPEWGAASGLLGGAAVSVFLTGLINPWPTYASARAYLALLGLLPWPLLDFLEDAHRRGVLRQAGAVYQFRHIELQRRLAASYREPPPRWWQLPRQVRRTRTKWLHRKPAG